jgi:hypothetical protein
MEIRMTDSILYHDGNRRLQDAFDSRRIADRLESKLARTAFKRRRQGFHRERDLFSSSPPPMLPAGRQLLQGRTAGLRARHRRQRAGLPDYDGNGMFKSLGNLLENPHVGLLFIDMHGKPRRLRITARRRSHATIRCLPPPWARN